MKSSKAAVAALVWLVATIGFSQDTITGGGLSLQFMAEQGAVVGGSVLQPGNDLTNLTAAAVVLEGPQRVPLTGEGGIRIEHELEPAKGHLRWRVNVRNTTDKERLLEVRCGFLFQSGSPLRLWDGFELYDPPQSNSVRSLLAQTFPMSCVYGDHSGLAVGLAPESLYSWLEQGFNTTPQRSRLTMGVRLALGPKQSETATFVLYSFRAQYGFREALQVYYDQFPEWFRARDDVDQRVTGGGATYWSWTVNSPEMCRRFRGDWEWCYAPFRRTGDWYGRDDLWEYKPARPIGKDRALPRADFLARRAAQFERGKNCDVAMLFYLPANIWCEIQLANERYKDAIVMSRDKNTGENHAIEYHRPWVTGHDDELIVFPWATSFAESCMRDMKQIASELNVAGFAFDTANGGIPYRGPGSVKSPGRAWDDEGAFVDLGIAVAKMEDFVHTLRNRDNKRCALVSNPTGRTTFPICFRSDAAMHEYAPYRHLPEQESLRFLLGHKPMIWWDDYAASSLLKWQEMSPDEIRQAWLGLADFVLLRSLYVGGIPTPRLTAGIPRLVKALPMMYEVARAGWQPVPAYRISGLREGDKQIWKARYGAGLGSFLTLGNASETTFDGTLNIENRYLAPNALLFAPYDNGALSQKCDGGITALTLKVATRQAAVMKPVLALPETWAGSAKVQQGDEMLRIDLENKDTKHAKIAKLRVPATHRLSKLTINDRPADFSEEKDAARFRIPATDKVSIEVEFASRYVMASKQPIIEFPFDKASILLPDGSSAAAKVAANRIQEYFRFYRRNELKQVRNVVMEIRDSDKYTSGEAVIRFDSGLTRVKDGALLVNPSPAAMQVLLELLDQKYFYAGRFPTGGETENEKELIKKSGLGGKLLE